MSECRECRLCPRRVRRAADGGGGRRLLRHGHRPGDRARGAAPLGGALHQRHPGPRGVFFPGFPPFFPLSRNSRLGGGGRAGDVGRLSEIFRELEGEGAHNLNLVTGTQFIPAVLEALELYRPGIPVVWNSSGYERVETLRMLEGHVDVYLPDMKYWDARQAALLSGAEDYPETARAAIREMRRQTGEAVYDAEGMMLRGTLVRHLVLPGLTADAMRILTWIADELPGTPVSLMGQYVPFGEAASIPGMNRRLTAREYARVLAHMEAAGLEGYRQLPASADEAFIPAFDGEGVLRPAGAE